MNEINDQTSVSFWEWLGKVDPYSSATSSLDCSMVKSRTPSVCVDWLQAEGNPVISSMSIEASGIEVSKMNN